MGPAFSVGRTNSAASRVLMPACAAGGRESNRVPVAIRVVKDLVLLDFFESARRLVEQWATAETNLP